MENYSVQGDSEEPQLSGRPTTDESQSRQTEINIRNDITSKFKENNYTYPKSNWYRENNRFVNT